MHKAVKGKSNKTTFVGSIDIMYNRTHDWSSFWIWTWTQATFTILQVNSMQTSTACSACFMEWRFLVVDMHQQVSFWNQTGKKTWPPGLLVPLLEIPQASPFMYLSEATCVCWSVIQAPLATRQLSVFSLPHWISATESNGLFFFYKILWNLTNQNVCLCFIASWPDSHWEKLYKSHKKLRFFNQVICIS